MINNGVDGRFVDILLVEDNLGDARHIELLLEMTDDAYRLHTADSVKSALQSLATLPAQVILLDLGLPDSDGVETIRTLHSAYPWVPIVVLTGLDDEQMVADAATAGAHDYLVKQDLTSTSLWRVLRYALERRFHEEQVRTTQSLYRRQARELNLLNRIISAAAASSEEQKILRDTCLELAEFYSTWRTLILLRHHQDSIATVEAEHCRPDIQSLLHKQIDLDTDASLTAVCLTRQTLVLPTLPLSLKQFLVTPENSKAIIHPLLVEGENIGFLLLNLPETHELSAHDTQLVATVAEEIDLALEKIRLHGRLQAHAKELEERVRKRTQALAEANEKLKSLDQLKSKFVSDVSHELRNPITNLTIYLELLEFAPPDRQAKYYDILRTQVRRLSSLVEEILTLSRLENGSDHDLHQSVDLNYLVQQTVTAHTPRAQSKKIKLRFTPAIPLPPAWGEPNQITQIVTNLLDNALNYTAGGYIDITTDLQEQENKTEIVLGVSDSGRGIPEEDLPHIFERFYRGSQVDRDAIAGTGLGLGIVREIVALHNGRIDVQSIPNKGSRFTVTLPAAPQE